MDRAGPDLPHQIQGRKTFNTRCYLSVSHFELLALYKQPIKKKITFGNSHRLNYFLMLMAPHNQLNLFMEFIIICSGKAVAYGITISASVQVNITTQCCFVYDTKLNFLCCSTSADFHYFRLIQLRASFLTSALNRYLK